MDTDFANTLARLTAQAEAVLSQVETVIDITPHRALLRLKGMYGNYRIFITEVASQETRKYSYYALHDQWVEVGFDNAADPEALRLKFGRITPDKVGALIPHQHSQNKTQLTLTEEMTIPLFLQWLQTHLPSP